MNNRITFCENCRKDVTYKVKNIVMHSILKDVEYEYLGKEAYCDCCGKRVYVHEINDFNLDALYREYRLKNGIISLEKINEIPLKYKIGKRPLSLLLGWGELTFTRYCDGDLPTKQYSDVLNKIYDDPLYYLQILEDGKNRLKSIKSYEKSKTVVYQLLGINSNIEVKASSKIDQTVCYLIEKCEDITPLALQKALYYIQGFYSAFNHGFIFLEDCEAWIHGPVYRDVYFRYRFYQYDLFNSNKEKQSYDFSMKEKEVIDCVIKYFCCYSGKILEEFTHLEEPWLLARGSLDQLVPSKNIISRESIYHYFSSVKKDYQMSQVVDIQFYAKDLFRRIQKSEKKTNSD